MSQLNVYVPEDLEKKVKKRAKTSGKSLSAFLTDLLRREVAPREWKADFFSKIVGGWEGTFDPIDRPKPEDRKGL